MRWRLAIALLLAATAARADIDCDNAKNQNELNTCAEDNYRAADKTMNEFWAALDETVRVKLRPGQRAWIAARDAKCEATADEAEGGSMYPLLYFGCMTDQTRERTRWLRAHAE